MNEQLGEELRRNEVKFGGIRILADNSGKLLVRVQKAQRSYGVAQFAKNTSPSGGLMNMFRTEDITLVNRRSRKVALQSTDKITARRASPEAGLGAKLHDFVDSALERKAASLMGDDARGGSLW